MKEFLGESHRARHEAKLEKSQKDIDIEIFDNMVKDVLNLSEEASERLEGDYPAVFDLYKNVDSGDASSGEYAQFREYKDSEEHPEIA